ncbi:MAG: asparaginase [Gemmatimonadota bacterium]
MNIAPPAHVPLVVATRGDLAELVHVGSIAVVDAAGRLIAGVGDPTAFNFTRSSLKPLQALPFVADGGMGRFEFTSHELALMCASHSGEAIHVATVQRMLDRIGLAEPDLQCGCHPPTYYVHTATQAPPGARWNQLHHNCSGKHSGFLAWCRLHDRPTRTYLDPDAPLQRRVRDVVRGYAGGAEPPMGIDGCSAPNFALPLTGLAQAFCDLATGRTAEHAALAFAMTRHPDLVSGTARSDLALMQAGRGDWVTKIGADGVQAIGIASRGIGIAIRMADGNTRALLAAAVEVLQQLGLLGDAETTPLAKYARPQIKNYRGTVVGRVEPLFALPKVSL